MTHSHLPAPRWFIASALLCAVVYAGLTFFDISFVRVEKDEGFYVYAFRLIAEGKVLYRDFSYIESPALPYYYRILLAGPGITMHSVRVAGALTGLAALLILTGCAARAGGPRAAAIAAVLLFANPYLAEWFARDVTYPLVTLLVALTLWVGLTRWPAPLRTGTQGILLALLGCAKASMGLVSVIWMAMVLWGHRKERRVLIAGAGSFLGGVALCLGPFLIACPEAFLFDVIQVPLARNQLFPHMRRLDPLDQWLEFGWGQRLIGLRTVLLWNLPAMVILAIGLARAARCRRDGLRGPGWGRPAVTALAAGSLFHLIVPSPAYPNYQFLALPALTLFFALLYAGGPDPEGRAPVGYFLLPLLLGAGHFAGGVRPEDLGLQIGTRRHGPQAEFTRLVADLVPPGGTLLTDYLPVAVDANRHVVPGNEAGRSSLIPDLPDSTARAMHFLNRRLFLDILDRGEADAVVVTQQLTEQSFDPMPEFVAAIEQSLAEHYELRREFPAGPYFVYGRIRVFAVRGRDRPGVEAAPP